MPLRFGHFSLEENDGSLAGPDGVVELSGRSADILKALLARPGDLVTKDQILDAAWPGVVVEENTLHVHMSALRKAIGTDMIATVHGRGYRYVGPPPVDVPRVDAAPRRRGRGGNLSRFGVDCVFRDAEALVLINLIKRQRLVTILGPGGVGKTTLALHLARELESSFEDGVWAVDLASIGDGALVETAIGQILGVQFRAQGAPLRALVDALRPLSTLLVLDNCEHVAPAVARTIRELLSEAPGLSVLATSQVPLAVNGEQLFKLTPFALTSSAGSEIGAAESFFIHCYEAQGERLTTDELPVVAQLCRRLDGIALALKMAAARSATLSLKEVDRQIASQMASLSAEGNAADSGRHRSLTASLNWSYDLLTQEDQRVLRALSVFSGSFTVDGVRFVAGDGAAESLSELVRRSLVVRDMNDRTRYRLLETTRQFALRLVVEAGEEEGARSRLAAFMANRFSESLATWESVADEEWVATYRPDTDNLRRAHEWAKARSDWKLFVSLAAYSYRYWIEVQLPGEGLEFVEAATAFVDDVDGKLKGQLFLAVAELARVNALDLRSLEALDIALRELEPSGDPLVAHALVLQGAHLTFLGRFDAARPVIARLEVLSRTMVPSKLLAWTLVTIGLFTWSARDRDAGLAKVRAGLAMHLQQGNHRGRFRSALYFAEMMHRDGDNDRAIELAQNVIPDLRARGSALELGAQISNLACYSMAAENAAIARPAILEAWRLLPRDHATWYWCILQNATELASIDGRYEDAALLLGFVDKCFEGWADGRQPTEAKQRGRIEARLLKALPNSRYEELRLRGRAMAPFEAEMTGGLQTSVRSATTVGGHMRT